jgi:hypothetical protein
MSIFTGYIGRFGNHRFSVSRFWIAHSNTLCFHAAATRASFVVVGCPWRCRRRCCPVATWHRHRPPPNIHRWPPSHRLTRSRMPRLARPSRLAKPPRTPPSTTSAACLTRCLRPLTTPLPPWQPHRPARPPRTAATSGGLHLPQRKEPGDWPALDPTPRPPLPALITPVGHLFAPWTPPTAMPPWTLMRSQPSQILYFE